MENVLKCDRKVAMFKLTSFRASAAALTSSSANTFSCSNTWERKKRLNKFNSVAKSNTKQYCFRV